MRQDLNDVTALLKRLCAGYGHRMTDTELAQAVTVWRDILEGAPWPEVELAVDGFLKEPGRFMPKVGEVRSRALELARRRFHAPTNGERLIWHTERWSEGFDPESGRPGLCSKCGNWEWFTRTPENVWHGYVTHRESCGTARRKEAA